MANLEEQPSDRDSSLERVSAIGKGYQLDMERLRDPVKSRLDMVRWALGFGRKGDYEKAIDADVEAGNKEGKRDLVSIFTGLLDDDTLVLESRARKGVRWAPRVFWAGLTAAAIASSGYGAKIKDGFTTSYDKTVKYLTDSHQK